MTLTLKIKLATCKRQSGVSVKMVKMTRQAVILLDQLINNDIGAKNPNQSKQSVHLLQGKECLNTCIVNVSV